VKNIQVYVPMEYGQTFCILSNDFKLLEDLCKHRSVMGFHINKQFYNNSIFDMVGLVEIRI